MIASLPILLAILLSPNTANAASCTAIGDCLNDGTSAYFDTSGITYNSATGKFSGNLVSNLCPNYVHSNYSYSGTTWTSYGKAKPTCVTKNVAQYASAAPTAAPLREAIGYTVAGVLIFGPMDNGFLVGQACTSTTTGTCDSGTDVDACFIQMAQQCGSTFLPYMGTDLCGGHASPYHNHKDFVCLYDRNSTGHSPLIGFALDGRGIYGFKESSYSYPTDLDWCGGHYGNVPATTINGVTYPAASNVYHYHTQPQAPFTVGCYGPITSYAACAALYPTCGTGTSTLTGVDSSGSSCSYSYDTDCPCFGAGLTFNKNQMCAVTTVVPAAVTYTAWGTSTTTSSALSTGAIVGIVIGSIVGLAAIVGIALFVRSRMIKKTQGSVAVASSELEAK
ncbi:YHYH protein-domain-containing protein [Obelidium mucronatum]|nr:YHYH protein-domain-containing protein [Obelidium mucronatum]